MAFTMAFMDLVPISCPCVRPGHQAMAEQMGAAVNNLRNLEDAFRAGRVTLANNDGSQALQQLFSRDDFYHLLNFTMNYRRLLESTLQSHVRDWFTVADSLYDMSQNLGGTLTGCVVCCRFRGDPRILQAKYLNALRDFFFGILREIMP